MALPSKDYHRLKSLRKKWDFSQEDIFYALENSMLRACIWLPLRYVEKVAVKNRQFIYEAHEHQEGFVGVRPEDCRRICGTGRAKLRVFTSVCHDNHIYRLAYEPPQPSISVSINDLLILKADRIVFEEKYDVSETNVREIRPQQPNFSASEDYRYVRLGEIEYHLGDVQSRVIQMLHEAALSHNPWVHAKTLIHESGSQADRFKDLFKHQSHWRKMVISNERGYYRLNLSMEHLNGHIPAFDQCASSGSR